MSWQTKLDTYSKFPRCCEWFQKQIDHTPNAYDDETAFYCGHFIIHRIIESECLGDECPDCKLVGFDEYQKAIGGVNQ